MVGVPQTARPATCLRKSSLLVIQ